MWALNFLKPFLRGNILQSGEWERGVNSRFFTILRFWPTSWKYRTFCLMASFLARQRIIFKKNCPKRIFPSDFVKLGSEVGNTLFIFGRKMVVFVCCNTLSDFGLLFKNLSTHRAEKVAFKEKIIRCTARKLLNPYKYKVPTQILQISLDLQRCNWALTSRQYKHIFQNEVQRVLYKLVFIPIQFDHSERINSPFNFRFIKKMRPYNSITTVILLNINL